ncbi:MAG: hypothetical protein QOH37_1536 [Nocardioidaceae bacterium]|nr:hypothetical protein [Nocardioidaceae bacterium]
MQVVDGDVQVGCGGATGWAASVMTAGRPGVLTQAQVEDAFTSLLADAKYQGELSRSFLEDGASATRWRVLRVDGDTYTLGLGRWTARGPGNGATVFEIQGYPGSWTWAGGGACHLAPVLASGHEWMAVTAPTVGLDRTSTEPEVGLSEGACSSGRDPRPYLHTPVVRETRTTVTVFWTATPPEGIQDCVGRAPVDVSLHLPSPLGERMLLDGSTYPPTRVGRTSPSPPEPAH